MNIKKSVFVDCKDSSVVPESVSLSLLFFLAEATGK